MFKNMFLDLMYVIKAGSSVSKFVNVINPFDLVSPL
jgi:hypothetical protein